MMRKPRGMGRIVLLILSFAPGAAAREDPPPDLVRRVAALEAETEAARSRYAYRQTVRVSEFGNRGVIAGEYRETREVVFLDGARREERAVGKPSNGLHRLVLTAEDFDDIRHIQPLLTTTEELARYQVRFRGEETVNGIDCWVLDFRPKQLLGGMRAFEGLAWAAKDTLAVVRTEGRAVPPVYHDGQENLFPAFVTTRKPVDGLHWFPALTIADDVLPFRSGPLRMRMEIRYEQYQKFGAETKITFDPPPEK
jgi:hypothetical protein